MDECINENYTPQREVSAPGVTQTRDRVLRDKTNVAHHGTPPQKNKGAGKLLIALVRAKLTWLS